MEICSDCDIVFNERNCPLCAAQNEIKILNELIDDLKDKIYDLENKE